jgi:hypothetical protein
MNTPQATTQPSPSQMPNWLFGIYIGFGIVSLALNLAFFIANKVLR